MIKLKNGFILRQVAGEYIVIPSGNEYDLDVMITLNESGVLLWNELEKGCDKAMLVKTLLNNYEVDESTAINSVEKFIEKLNKHELLK